MQSSDGDRTRDVRTYVNETGFDRRWCGLGAGAHRHHRAGLRSGKARVLDFDDAFDVASGRARNRVRAAARVGNRQPQRLTLGGAPILQFEANTIDGRRAGLDDAVRNVAGFGDIVDSHVNGVARDKAPRRAPAVAVVKLLLHAEEGRPKRVLRNPEIRELLQDRVRRVGIGGLRITRRARTRLDRHADKRHVGHLADHSVAGRHDRGLAGVLRERRNCGDEARGQTRYDPHTTLNPMLYAYVSGGTLWRYAQRSIDKSSFTQEPPRTMRMLPDAGPRGSRASPWP